MKYLLSTLFLTTLISCTTMTPEQLADVRRQDQDKQARICKAAIGSCIKPSWTGNPSPDTVRNRR